VTDAGKGNERGRSGQREDNQGYTLHVMAGYGTWVLPEGLVAMAVARVQHRALPKK
jgi:hypothetical protein